ncbi:MAG TPA: TonB-dependent receptor [Pyrinomonadaceae bacterium]
MTTLRNFSRVFWALLLVAVFALPATAQSNKGTITGTITDPQGAVVKDAKVTATNTATGEAREATTGDEGTYSLPALDPGLYRVTVDASGFSQSVVEEVKLDTAGRQAIDVTLTAGGVSGGTVTVTAEAPLAETETSVRGDLITGKQVTDLPISQRNFTLLATLSPGVTRPVVGVLGGGGNFEAGANPTGTSTESTRFRESGGSVLVVNGARPTNNNFTLDGADNNEGQFGQIGIYPPPDAIAEFKIETSVAPAENGRAGGGIISATTKSGGNRLHGSAYEFYQGRVAGALSRKDHDDLRANRGLTNRNTHQFGFTTGGPVFLPRFGEGTPYLYDGRNKTFWFVYYEGQRNATPSTTGDFGAVSVPTVRMRVGDFSELLQPGTSRAFNTINGTINAPIGTVFCPNGIPAAGNDIRNCGVALSQAALNVLQAYPVPNATGQGLGDNFATNRKEKYNRDGYGLRFDHNISGTDSIFFAYSSDKSSRARDNNFPIGASPTGNDLPSGFGAGNEFGDSRGVRLGETHIFSPTVINDARFGATRVEIGIFNTGVGGALGFDPNVSANLGIPNTNICGECTGSILLGIEEPFQRGRQNQLEFIGDGGPFYFTSNNFSFADGLTWVRGTSTFKFGGDLRVRQNSNFDAGRAGAIKGQYQYGTASGGFLAGNYNGVFGPTDSGSGTANFLFGYNPGFTSRGTPGTPPFLSNKEISFFGQDDWKVSQTLTLNLGLRYDIFTQPTERFDAQANYNPANDTLVRAGESAPGGRDLVNSDHNNFGPSLGFAWSGFKEDKTVVLRGGYAIKYAVDTPGIPGVLQANSPQAGSYGCSFNQLGTSACPQLPARFNLDTGIPLPLVALNIAPGQTFTPAGGATVVRVDPDIKNELFHQFNLTGQWEFRPNWLAEIGYVGSRGRNLLVVRNLGNNSSGFPGARVVNTRGTVQSIEYIGASQYDSLQTKVERRFTGGLSLITSYVWSHSIDNSPGNFCTGGTGPSTCGFSNPLRPELDRGNSDFDVRHRFSFASVWELPFGRGRRFGKDVPRAADLLIGGWQLNTDLYVQSGPVYSVFANGRRVDLVGDPTPTAANLADGRFLNPAAFRAAVTPVFASDPTGPTFGNLGRNVFRGERMEFVNASLFKNFRFGESFNVQLRAQAYNLFNHVNRFRPNTDLNSGDFGRDTAEQRRRQLEFGLRVEF